MSAAIVTVEDAIVVPKTHTYKTLDAWRGIACLWVVMVHACLPAISMRYPALRFQPLYAFSLFGGLGVQLFFVISGYCIANAASSTIRKKSGVVYFLRARVRRIYPPYFFASAFTFSLSYLTLALVRKGYLHSSVLASAVTGHQSPLYYFSALTLTQIPLHQKPILIVFWTLCYEIAFYSIFALLLAIGRQRMSEQFMLNCLHVLTALSLMYLIFMPEHRAFPFDFWPQFGLGVLVYDVLEHKRKTTQFFGCLIASEIIVFALLHNYGGHLGQEGSRTQFLASLVFALVLVALSGYDEKLKQLRIIQFLSSIGLFSYSLYLTHLLTLGLVMQIFSKVSKSQSFFVVPFFVQIVLAVSVAYCFYILFERPFLNKNSRKVRPAQIEAA